MNEDRQPDAPVAPDRPWEELLYDPDPSTRHLRPPTLNLDGVCVGQIRGFLDLSPQERLDSVQSLADFVRQVRYPGAPVDLRELLQVLTRHRVEFVLVGDLAATLQGSPTSALAVEMVPRRDAANASRLSATLDSIHARDREHPQGAPAMSSRRSLMQADDTLATDLGPLDVVWSLAGKGYEEWLPLTGLLQVGDSMTVRVLCLKAIIATRRDAGLPKDLAMLPVLEETLREIRRRQGEDA